MKTPFSEGFHTQSSFHGFTIRDSPAYHLRIRYAPCPGSITIHTGSVSAFIFITYLAVRGPAVIAATISATTIITSIFFRKIS